MAVISPAIPLSLWERELLEIVLLEPKQFPPSRSNSTRSNGLARGSLHF